MGMIFLYIHIPHILHILSTQSYPPVSLLPPISYILCYPIYSLPVFSRLPIPSFSFSISSLRRFVFRRASVRWIAFRSHRLSASRLVGRAVGRSVPFRLSPCFSFRFVRPSRSCRVVGRCAVFLSSFSRVVLSCHERSFPRGGVVLRPGLSSRWGVPVSSVVPSIGSSRRFGFLCVSSGRLV